MKKEWNRNIKSPPDFDHDWMGWLGKRTFNSQTTLISLSDFKEIWKIFNKINLKDYYSLKENSSDFMQVDTPGFSTIFRFIVDDKVIANWYKPNVRYQIKTKDFIAPLDEINEFLRKKFDERIRNPIIPVKFKLSLESSSGIGKGYESLNLNKNGENIELEISDDKSRTKVLKINSEKFNKLWGEFLELRILDEYAHMTNCGPIPYFTIRAYVEDFEVRNDMYTFFPRHFIQGMRESDEGTNEYRAAGKFFRSLWKKLDSFGGNELDPFYEPRSDFLKVVAAVNDSAWNPVDDFAKIPGVVYFPSRSWADIVFLQAFNPNEQQRVVTHYYHLAKPERLDFDLVRHSFVASGLKIAVTECAGIYLITVAETKGTNNALRDPATRLADAASKILNLSSPVKFIEIAGDGSRKVFSTNPLLTPSQLKIWSNRIDGVVEDGRVSLICYKIHWSKRMVGDMIKWFPEEFRNRPK